MKFSYTHNKMCFSCHFDIISVCKSKLGRKFESRIILGEPLEEKWSLNLQLNHVSCLIVKLGCGIRSGEVA